VLCPKMTNPINSSIPDEITARLVAEAQAKIAREFPQDSAELVRIVRKWNLDLQTIAKIIGDAGDPAQTAIATVTPAYDGTFSGLMSVYQTHDKSSIHKLKHSVRANYIRTLNRLEREIGKQRIADWTAQTVQNNYERWKGDDKVAIAHELVGKLRLLTSFGVTELNDDYCIKLNLILSKMRFEIAKGQGGYVRLNREQTRALRMTAREHFGWDSIALAAAIQFEFPKLKQLDIIGEWVPLSDPAKSEIIKGDEKWVRGLKWSDLDEDYNLKRVIQSGPRGPKKEVVYKLKRAQMTIEEINRVPLAKRTSAMIMCEYSNIPWSNNEFRRKWKIVAEKAGISLTHSQPDEDENGHESGAETAS
jgi:hypothetical protein